jgi:hypothetical protein
LWVRLQVESPGFPLANRLPVQGWPSPSLHPSLSHAPDPLLSVTLQILRSLCLPHRHTATAVDVGHGPLPSSLSPYMLSPYIMMPGLRTWVTRAVAESSALKKVGRPYLKEAHALRLILVDMSAFFTHPLGSCMPRRRTVRPIRDGSRGTA